MSPPRAGTLLYRRMSSGNRLQHVRPFVYSEAEAEPFIGRGHFSSQLHAKQEPPTAHAARCSIFREASWSAPVLWRFSQSPVRS
jgi:hypothetical protein